MKDYKLMTVGQIVADRFDHAKVFNKYGIDFCCNGDVSLTDACERAGAGVDSLLEELRQTQPNHSPIFDFKSWPMDLLVDYILKFHHRNIRYQGPQILQLLDKVCEVHGEKHPELHEIRGLFQESWIDLNNHLTKEEMVLFPYIYDLFDAVTQHRPVPAFHCGSVSSPISVMMHEHDAEGERFRRISLLAQGYLVPDDACDTYRLLFEMLETFEKNLHHHIHLENNIVFPMAIELQENCERMC